MEPARLLEAVPCPLCASETGLEIALRLELEAESERLFAACVDCNRLYEVTPEGTLRPETDLHRELAVRQVVCPRCAAEGSVLSYSLPAAEAESYLLVTCPVCQHVFQPGS
jgi:DNA-directed RNA polymerase subunit M/transcription elongation factor TFIIS